MYVMQPSAVLDMRPAEMLSRNSAANAPRMAVYATLKADAPQSFAAAGLGDRLELSQLPSIREALGGAPVSVLDMPIFDPDCFRCGNIHAHADAWREVSAKHPLHASIMDWVEHGVRVAPFMCHFKGSFKGQQYDCDFPPPREFCNDPIVYSPEFAPFVRGEIAAGVQNGSITLLGPSTDPRNKPYLVLPLSVEPKKPRLIYDGRFFNLWCKHMPMRYDTAFDLARAASTGDALTVWDHKSGYHHVALAPQSRTLFGFEFEGFYYQYNVVPFGWNESPFIYQTLSEAVSGYLRELGLKDFSYLDDSATANAPHLIVRDAYVKLVLLTLLGYFINTKKSVLLPGPVQRWLGLLVDLASRTFRIPDDKLQSFLQLISSALSVGHVSLPQLEKIAGKCVSFAPAVPGALLFTRAMYDAITSALRQHGRDYDTPPVIPLAGPLRTEFMVWNELRAWHGTRKWRSDAHIHVTVKVWSDASGGTGWGGMIQLADTGETILAGDTWSVDERSLNITAKEALGGMRTLQMLPPRVRDCVVVLATDNAGFDALLRSGKACTSWDVLAVQRAVMAWEAERNAHVMSEWIPTETNVTADWISRNAPHEDSLAGSIFRQTEAVWGPFSVDAMASAVNTKCPRYISRWASPAAVAADVFTCKLREEANIYCFPPQPMIGAVLSFFKEQRCKGVVVVPESPHQPWWPLVAPFGRNVVGEAGQSGVVYVPAPQGGWWDRPLAQRMVAVRFDYSSL